MLVVVSFEKKSELHEFVLSAMLLEATSTYKVLPIFCHPQYYHCGFENFRGERTLAQFDI
jgi:hypothetical protein